MPIKEKDKKGSGVTDRAREFFREVRSELRKVVWPTRRESLNLTMLVIGVSMAVGAFLGVVDFLFQEMFRIILQ
ncbi:MAG TPA: preprotein translocase subunit SecE [Chloroflexota bacterium]|nr:preprotein translocase subunit SecE [Chloroflexota bacterium]